MIFFQLTTLPIQITYEILNGVVYQGFLLAQSHKERINFHEIAK